MINEVCYTLLFIGGVGLLVQVFIGGHYSNNAHATHVHAAGHHAHGVGHSPGHHGYPSDHHGSSGADRLSLALAFLSPMTLFSVCLGAGASGLFIEHFRPSPVIVAAGAAVGGIAFYLLVSRPLMSLLLNFASKPSKALDGVVSEPAEVISRFNSSGQGLVNVTIDGQIVRILATLEESDKSIASEIVPGDHLVVTYVDGHSNACRVARI